MNYLYFNKIILIYYILCSILRKVKLDECLTHSFPQISYPKAKTLSNGYHIMISTKGIYSFTPQLSKIKYFYNFTETQKFSTNLFVVKNSLNQIEISQFNEEEGKNFVLIFVCNYIYFLNEYGKLKFFQKLNETIKIDFPIILLAYKYENGNYYFILAHNEYKVYGPSNNIFTIFYYYKIVNENEINLITKKSINLFDILSVNSLSCQIMKNSTFQKQLTCFFNFKYTDSYLNIAINFDPENEFLELSKSNSLNESDSQETKYFRSIVNNDMKKALVCYSLIYNEVKIKCFYYDSIKKEISDIFFEAEYCAGIGLFGFNTYYFEQTNEYIFSCIDKQLTAFSMKRINNDFILINDNENTYEKKSFTNCYGLDFFSIIYISKYQQYSVVFNSICNSKKNARIFMLSNSVCINQTNGEEEEDEEDPNIKTSFPEITTININLIPSTIISSSILKIISETTIPLIITTLPKIESTILSTILKNNIETTFPNIISTFCQILTTIPENIIETTIPNLITTIPNIISTNIETTIISTIPKNIILTTIPNIISTNIETTIISTMPKNIIETTIPNIISTNIETTIISTMPKNIIETTFPNIILTTIISTSFENILETTMHNIITTSPKIETTNIESTISKNILDIQSSITNFSILSTISEENQQNYSDEIEKKCDDNNKIKYKGKCICDTSKGFYSINYKSADNKCYKKSDLPKNMYFNNITQSYELCYKTCGTCIQGGNNTEHNCITCALNYIKEPNKNSSNCVINCKYLYYYNAMNKYSCTEDEQCPKEASLIVREKNKCVNICSNDDTHKYQYNGECLSSCPINTQVKSFNICQLIDINNCSMNDYLLNLDKNINQENVKLATKNYANEFHYTINHISRFLSQNFTMILYKNSSCVDKLNLNTTKIEYDSCIQQLKKDNNIEENKELIIVVIDILSGENPITSFGFFDSDTGEKLDASKSCNDKNVMMYEDILNILNDPSALNLLQSQKINIFDLNDNFYKDICFHFESPNGKDATLQDRIKTFYPNVTLCDEGCKNKGINVTTMKAECECTFQDLLSNNIFQNDIIGDNVLIKESLEDLMEILSNLNIEVLTCYKNVFNYKYFKKNIGGFIILFFFFFQILSFSYYYLVSKNKLIRYIYEITEKFIILKKNKKYNVSTIINPTKKIFVKENKIKYKNENRNVKNTENNPFRNKNKILKDSENLNIIRRNSEACKNKNNIKIFNRKDKKDKIFKNIIEDNSKKILILSKKKMNKKEKKLKTNSKIPIETSLIESKNSIGYLFGINHSQNKLHQKKNKKKNLSTYKTKNKSFNFNNYYKSNFLLKKSEIDTTKIFEPFFEDQDFDDVIEEDKRTFCQYYSQKIKKNQILIHSIFITEIVKPQSVKFAAFILIIDLYFLINGLFFSDSYISEIFNSKEKETFFSFIPRSVGRFVYSTLVGNIITYIIQFFFIEEIQIKKIFSKNKEDLNIRFEMYEILKSIVKRIKILTVFSFIITIFSWYYISCLNNVYPNIRKEWIISSIFLIIIMQILTFIISLLETSIRFIALKCESEKLFKLSLLFP